MTLTRGSTTTVKVCVKKEACALAAVAALWIAHPTQATAQQWPDKPVRVLVPFAAGGSTDVQARLLSTAFQKSMGPNFIVDSRTGAGGLIATQIAVDAPPDGNTILFTSGGISVMATVHASRMKFSMERDLAPISWISSTPLVLAVHPSVPARSVQALVALAKSKPGGLNVGGNTSGSTAHLSAEMLNQVAGIKAPVITYRGGGPAMIALISGEIDYIFATAPSVVPYLKSGKARALAVTTPKRSSMLPDLPTMNSIYPGFEADNWYAMFFPKGTPRPIVDKMNAEIRKALDTPDMRAFMLREVLDPVASSPEELAALLKRDIEKYAKVIRLANLKLE
jgi:tripartite-type tricarboxylate transporter receptor subunit TctC